MSAIMPTSTPTNVAKRMSKLRTWDISWAIDALKLVAAHHLAAVLR